MASLVLAGLCSGALSSDLTFSYANVQLALASDVAAVARFRHADPRGAQAITAYLEIWLQCLARWDSLAVARARDKGFWGPRSYYKKVAAGSQFTLRAIVRLVLDLSVVTEDEDSE